MEEIMLGVRLREGIPASVLSGEAFNFAERHVASANLDLASFRSGRVVLTRPGRLLADAVTRDLT
jgi:oxygen-independent coproporphyrinogen-3 oxidase